MNRRGRKRAGLAIDENTEASAEDLCCKEVVSLSYKDFGKEKGDYTVVDYPPMDTLLVSKDFDDEFKLPDAYASMK